MPLGMFSSIFWSYDESIGPGLYHFLEKQLAIQKNCFRNGTIFYIVDMAGCCKTRYNFLVPVKEFSQRDARKSFCGSH